MTGMLRSVVLFVGYSLFFGAAVGADNAAHIGGLLMGLLLGALIAKVAPGHDDFLRRIAVLLVGALLVVGGILWLQHSLRLHVSWIKRAGMRRLGGRVRRGKPRLYSTGC